MVSDAVTFTLTVFRPTLSGTWNPSAVESASVSVLFDPSRYSTVAADCLVVAVIVPWLTELATTAV